MFLISPRSQGLKQHWPIGDDEGLKKKADFGLKTMVDDHMVLIAEAKTSENRTSCDLKKIANCMKATLDRSQQKGYGDASVCGLFIKGPHFKILYMDHQYKGGYRLFDLYSFTAPTNHHDHHNLENFYQGTVVLDHVVRMVYNTYKRARSANVPKATIFVEVARGDIQQHLQKMKRKMKKESKNQKKIRST